ncbi:MAG: type I-F CRISPR-associated endoribonuclease Cas6/Csy4 [Candidatus Thiodiazotropha sp. (ex Dulcina madagascariensis)]|nr:type I-F CRISPR-associated endoribonuclease Cas6/Csy4 [Candidatus Thiodiazotropha sp. (ex Dulcina madagascariensis)]
MDHYLEIRLLPDPEFSPGLLMSALFAKLHRALVDLDSKTIGISFPDIGKQTLGHRLRLHSTADELKCLMTLNWLTGMGDHVTIKEPGPIPEAVSYRVVQRMQAKSNPERLRRRQIKRKRLDQEQARQAIPDAVAERLDLPFVTVKSRSNGQRFRLFIDQGPARAEPVNGLFSHYGLSATATVPWF